MALTSAPDAMRIIAITKHNLFLPLHFDKKEGMFGDYEKVELFA